MVGVKITPQRSASARSGRTLPSKSVTSRAPHRSSCSDREVLAHVVVDVLLRQHLGVQLGAVGAAALLEDDGEALARGLGLREVLPEIEEGELEPALMIEPVRLLGGLDARRRRGRPAAARAGIGGAGAPAGPASRSAKARSRPRQASRCGSDRIRQSSAFGAVLTMRQSWAARAWRDRCELTALFRRRQRRGRLALGDARWPPAAPRCRRPRAAPARTGGGGRRAPAAGRGKGRGCGASRC